MKKILIADDDMDILNLVSMLLRHNNFIVKTISNCNHIFETIKNFLPNLILLDISLGDTDGRDICKQIKQSGETRDIPVILFSAHHDLINHIKGYLSNGSVNKPFEIPVLLETIRKNIA
jgi:DNA-binding response OmpR family regulator